MWKICGFKIEVKPQSLLPAELVSLVVLKMVPLLHAQISFLCESSRKLNSKVTCIGFDGRIVGHDSYNSISQFPPKVLLSPGQKLQNLTCAVVTWRDFWLLKAGGFPAPHHMQLQVCSAENFGKVAQEYK